MLWFRQHSHTYSKDIIMIVEKEDNYPDWDQKKFNEIQDANDERWRQWKTLHDMGVNLVLAMSSHKHPVRYWKHLQDERQTDYQFNEWRREHGTNPNATMFAITGATPECKIVVVDADDKLAMALVETWCSSTPLTVQRTSEKCHYYYRHPLEDVKTVSKIVIDGEVLNIDIRGDGGGVVAPYSLHPSGDIYLPSVEITPELLESLPVYDPVWFNYTSSNGGREKGTTSEFVSTVPDRDYSMMVDDPSLPPLEVRLVRAKAYLAKCPGTTSGEEKKCMILCRKIVIGFALPETAAVDAIMEVWASNETQLDAGGYPWPWDWKQIAHKVRDAIKTRANHPFVKFGQMLSERATDWSYATDTLDDVVKPFEKYGDPAAASDAFGHKPKAEEPEEPDEEEEPTDIMGLKLLRTRALAIKRTMIADGWVQSGHLEVLTAREKRGKSTLVDDLITAVISGQKWLDAVDTIQVPVLLCDYENPEDYIWHHLGNMLQDRQADIDECDRYFGIVDPNHVRRTASPMSVDYAMKRIKVMQQKTGSSHGLFIIDTALPAWMELFDDPSWTNSNTCVRKALEIGQSIARKSGWAVIVVYHDNKAGTGPAGTYEWTAVPDAFIRLERPLESAIGEISIFGRLLFRPKPIQFKFDGRRLLAVQSGEMERERNEYSEGEELNAYMRVLSLVPPENACVSKDDMRTIGQNQKPKISKAIIDQYVNQGIKDGKIGMKLGPHNTHFIYRI
jgi:Bifunctional DNA primase/polymerase, N-terminal/AAA domain